MKAREKSINFIKDIAISSNFSSYKTFEFKFNPKDTVLVIHSAKVAEEDDLIIADYSEINDYILKINLKPKAYLFL